MNPQNGYRAHAHHDHHAHMVADFRQRFWISFLEAGHADRCEAAGPMDRDALGAGCLARPGSADPPDADRGAQGDGRWQHAGCPSGSASAGRSRAGAPRRKNSGQWRDRRRPLHGRRSPAHRRIRPARKAGRRRGDRRRRRWRRFPDHRGAKDQRREPRARRGSRWRARPKKPDRARDRLANRAARWLTVVALGNSASSHGRLDAGRGSADRLCPLGAWLRSW